MAFVTPSKNNVMTTAVIMQPTYLPWVGYFDLMERCDVFVFLDSVQFAKRSWQQRNRIKTQEGELMLTVPVVSKGLRDQLICDTRIDLTAEFEKKHTASLRAAYAKASHYKNISTGYQAIADKKHEKLADLNIELIKWLAGALEIKRKMVRSSDLGVSGKRSELLLDICKAVGAKSYLSPAGSREYLEEDAVLAGDNGTELLYHENVPVEYPQLHGAFMPFLSTIDLVMNRSAEEALDDIKRGRKVEAR